MTDNPTASAQTALLNTYPTFPFVLDSAEGDILRTVDGEEFIDLYGGHCVCSTGHGHPAIRAALHAQLDRLIFYSNAAEIAIRDEAATALVDYCSSGMHGVFFCNSGAEANENALKLAVQQTDRSKFVAVRGAFHGRTLLALSVTDDAKLRAPFEGLLAPTEFIELNDSVALESIDLHDVAAVILEPVQSMAGVRMADRAWLRSLRAKCTEAGALLIFDEIQTGMGRLGAPLAAEYFGVEPDMVTLAKGIASGIPMGALLVNQSTAARVKAGDLGSTFGGGPLACAAMLATLNVLQEEKLAERAAEIESRLKQDLAHIDWLKIRGAGLLLGLEAGTHAAALKARLFAQRLIVGGSNDPGVLRLMPPLTVSQPALNKLVSAIFEFDQLQKEDHI